MKTQKVVYLAILLSLVLTGCMPDSFTKFKEEPAKKAAPGTPVVGPPVIGGIEIDFDSLTMPTVLTYSSTPADVNSQIFIFQVGRATTDSGYESPCGNLRPVLDGDFEEYFCDDPFATDTLEQAELRVLVEALEFKFEMVAPNLVTGTPACDGAPVDNTQLPSGMFIDERQGYFSGTPAAIRSDSTAGANFGLPYPVGIRVEFKDKVAGFVTMRKICHTVKIAAYDIPIDRNFRYQQSATVKLELENYIGQGSIAAFSVGDNVTSLDPDGAGPLVAGQGTVIFVNATANEIIVDKTSGEFYTGVAIDDDSTFFGPEATVKKLTNVFQTSTTPGSINVSPLGLPPLIPSPGPYVNQTLGPENGVRFITDFESRPASLPFDPLTGRIGNDFASGLGYLQSEIQENKVQVAAINPLWQDDTYSFFSDVVNPATGAYVGNVRFTDLGDSYVSFGIEGTGQTTANASTVIVEENFEVTDPALDGGFSDQYLLAVNDMSNFVPGDFISTNTCGTGTNDSNQMTVGRVLATVNKGFPQLDYVLVQYIRGCRFKAGDSIDNSFPYKAPKATVYDAIPNSFVIETSDAGVLAWPSKEAGSATYHISAENGAKGVINLIQNGANPAGLGDGTEVGLGTANYIFVRMTSPVDIGDADLTTANEIDNYFSTTADVDPNPWDRRRENSIRPCQTFGGCVTPAATISNILASTLEVQATGNLAELNTGDTFSNNTNTTFGDVIDASNTARAVMVLNKGFLRAAQTITDSNPYDAATPNTISAVTYVPSFYLKKGTYYEFPFTLDKGTGTSAYFMNPVAPPPGMTFNTDTGLLEGVLTENLSLTPFETSASNGAGKTSFQSQFEVLQYFELAAVTSAANRNTSVVLHRAGQGNQLAPCGMFEAQMGVASCVGSGTNCGGGGCFNKYTCEADGGEWSLNNDITCYLEIGEEDLFYNGLKLRLEVAGAQCEFVAHKPYTLYKWQPGDTGSPDIYQHQFPATCNDTLYGPNAGTYDNKPLGTFSTDVEGTSTIGSVRDRCLYENGGFDYRDIYDTLGLSSTTQGPNCDEGDVQTQEVTWVAEGFKCYSGASGTGTLQSYGTVSECEANLGSCAGSATSCGGGGCLTQSTCESDSGTWTFTGSHNDCGNGCALGGSMVYEQNDCFRQTVTAGDLVACGGNNGQCAATSFKGVGTSTASISDNTKKERGGVISNLISADSAIEYNYYALDDTTGITRDKPRNEADNLSTALMANYYGEDLSCITSTYVYNVAGQRAAAVGNGSNALRSVFGTNPFYTYECRNASGDRKGIIRLLVRDWNQNFQSQAGFNEIDKALPGSLIDDGLDNYPDMDSGATTSNKCNIAGPPTLNFGGMGAGLPIAYPNDKL